MFEKLTQMLQNLQNNQNGFDPARFGDPMAARIDWRPARGGGSNIRTYKIVKVNPYRVEFKSTVGAVIFSLIFALPGLALLIFLIPHVNWFAPDSGSLIALLFGLTFTGLGGYMFYQQMLPIVFDKQTGFFWTGRKPPAEMGVDPVAAKYVRLENIYALQIVAEYISGKNSYYSYELNLVTQDGVRINVIDHGKRKRLAEDAQVLAEFLGVPVWDATMPLPASTFSVTGN